MSHKPCHYPCDFTDGDDPSEGSDLRDKGCCSPIPVKLDCLAPVIPGPECTDNDAELVPDPNTGEFLIWSTLFDQNCSAISDNNDSNILTLTD